MTNAESKDKLVQNLLHLTELLNYGGETFVVTQDGNSKVLTRAEVKEQIEKCRAMLASADTPTLAAQASEKLRLGYHWCTSRNADGRWSARILELPGCVADGETAVKAIEALGRAAQSWMMAALEEGYDVPVPHEGTKQFRPFHQGHIDEAEAGAAREAYKWARQRINGLSQQLDEKVWECTYALTPDPPCEQQDSAAEGNG